MIEVLLIVLLVVLLAGGGYGWRAGYVGGVGNPLGLILLVVNYHSCRLWSMDRVRLLVSELKSDRDQLAKSRSTSAN